MKSVATKSATDGRSPISPARVRKAVSEAVADFQRAFPALDVRFYARDRSLSAFLNSELNGADVVIVHEWNPPRLAAEIIALKRALGFEALFHDTHHRAYTSPGEIMRFPLAEFDGVLAFGEAIRRIYADGFGVKRVWTFMKLPMSVIFFRNRAEKDTDVAWIGNWGDGERTRELEEFIIKPAAGLSGYKIAVHGVRYPKDALGRLADSGIEFSRIPPQSARPTNVFPQPRESPCATPFLFQRAEWSADDPRLRSACGRLAAGMCALVRQRNSVPCREGLYLRSRLPIDDCGACSSSCVTTKLVIRLLPTDSKPFAPDIPARTGRSNWSKSAARCSENNENLRFRIQPDFMLLERGSHLLPRNLQKFARTWPPCHICGT